MSFQSKALETLRDVSEALAMAPARSAYAALAELLVDTLPGRAASLILAGQVQAEVGFPMETHAELARQAGLELAPKAEGDGRILEIPDTRRGPFSSRDLGIKLHASGYTGAFVVPITARESTYGSVVVWVDELYRGDPFVRCFLETIAHQLGLALSRDSSPGRGEVSLSALGEMNRLASLGLLIDSSLHALRAPSSSLLIQIDELRRLTQELGLLVDPTDSALDDVLREMRVTVDDMGIASSLVRRELLRISDATENRQGTERVALSLVLHEAVQVARPELEQQGFTIEETFARDHQVEADRHTLLQTFLGAILAIARDPAVHGRFPRIEVHLGGDDEASVRITARASMSHFLPPLTCAPEAVQNLVQSLRGELSEGMGSITIKLQTARAPESSSSDLARPSLAPRMRRILLVDDDPMFARALRRALSPHDVRICGTASEVEIALLDPAYIPDLVVCDLWLPGTNGRELHEKVARKHPHLAGRFVFVSGAPITARDLEYFKSQGCESLTKPIALDDILRCLERESDTAAPLTPRRGIPEADLGLL